MPTTVLSAAMRDFLLVLLDQGACLFPNILKIRGFGGTVVLRVAHARQRLGVATSVAPYD